MKTEDLEDIAEFIRTVVAMRQAQKDYFRTRSQQSLLASKDLEKQVDKDAKTILRKLEKEGIL